jgi:hypothetical protein
MKAKHGTIWLSWLEVIAFPTFFGQGSGNGTLDFDKFFSARPGQNQIDSKYYGTSVSYFNSSVRYTARNNWKSQVLKINESLKNVCSDKLQNFRFRTLNNKSWIFADKLLHYKLKKKVWFSLKNLRGRWKLTFQDVSPVGTDKTVQLLLSPSYNFE